MKLLSHNYERICAPVKKDVLKSLGEIVLTIRTFYTNSR